MPWTLNLRKKDQILEYTTAETLRLALAAWKANWKIKYSTLDKPNELINTRKRSQPEGYLSTDVDECVRGLHSCRQDAEACFNVAGSYWCGCQWGYSFESETQQCVPNDALTAAITQTYGPDTAREKGEPGKPGRPSSAERKHWHSSTRYEGWNFNSGNYLFTTDTK